MKVLLHELVVEEDPGEEVDEGDVGGEQGYHLEEGAGADAGAGAGAGAGYHGAL